jgi:hypothetical protein
MQEYVKVIFRNKELETTNTNECEIECSKEKFLEAAELYQKGINSLIVALKNEEEENCDKRWESAKETLIVLAETLLPPSESLYEPTLEEKRTILYHLVNSI